jgi:hypothetical protein
MTAYEYIKPLYGFLFLRSGSAPATRAHRFLRAAASIATGTRLQSRECLSRLLALPTDTFPMTGGRDQ